jgi:peptidoglycan-associated lipoprotein
MPFPSLLATLLVPALMLQAPPPWAAEPAALMAIIHFDADQTEIPKTEEASLGRVAAYLLEHPAAQVEIQGHTDPFGTEEFKLALGGRYAEAVRAWLLAKGVPPAQLQTISFGKQNPRYRGKEHGKALRNARCEFRLL